MRAPRLIAAALLFAACGTTPDERPPTLEVLTFEVFAPTCGQVQCHSSFTSNEGYAFDTLEGAKTTLGQLSVTANDGGTLYLVLDGAAGYERMPPDVPLAKQDRALIEAWVNAGAPGL